MSKLKIAGIVLVLLFIITGGLFFYASSKLKPDEIKRLTIEELKTLFPKSEVSLSNVEIVLGFTVNINLEKLSLKLMKDNSIIEMMSVDKLVVQVPIWAILTGGGVIEIKLDAPALNYQEFGIGNNWLYSMGDKKLIEEDKVKIDANFEDKNKKDETKGGAGVNPALSFFKKSKINLKFSDIAVKYGLRDNSKGEIKISKFLVKGLSFDSSTAFEIASNFDFIMKDQSRVAFNTITIGEFNIADLVKNGSVSSILIMKVNNISKSGLDWKIPEITTSIDFLFKKEGELSGNIATVFENQNKITAKFKMNKGIEISGINVEIFLKDIAAIIGLDKSIDLSKAKFLSKGIVNYGEDKKINANLNFSITPGIGYVKDGISATTSVSGDFKGTEFGFKAKTEALDGEIISAIKGEFDPNAKFEIEKLRPIDIRVSASGMKISDKMIRAKLWDKKVESQKEDQKEDQKDEKNEGAKGVVKKNAEEKSKIGAKGKDTSIDKKKEGNEVEKTTPGLPASNINLEWSNINIGGEDFSGKGKIITGMKAITVENLVFKFSKGNGSLNQTMILGKKSSESKFNFEMVNLNLSSFKSFLPPFVENFTGTFTGKVSGAATMFKEEKPPVFDVNLLVDAKKGEIKKLNISDYINPMLENIPVVKDKIKEKELKIDGNFETLTMKGRFTNSEYNIASFDFVGIDKKVQVIGNGSIYPPLSKEGKSSLVELSFIDNTGKISDVLLKNIGTKNLPMRISGPGFDMKPDYAYTLSKVAKGALKTKGEEKVKEIIEKNIDKIVPAAAKEKVKGILNGLFKRK